jgi:hypothetical protein
MSDKIKLYKNPFRNQSEVVTPYVPQYKKMDIEPTEFKSAVAQPYVESVPATPTVDNPRTRQPNMRQHYAKVVDSPVGRGRGPVPNVGNNLEHTWSSVNEEIIDDISELNSQHPMIDNNDYVSVDEFQKEAPTSLDEQFHPEPMIHQAPLASDDIVPILHNLLENDYLLIINGVAVCSGPVQEVQEQARLLVFGEHEMCDGNPVPVDDLLIVKKVPIKVGLFLE